MGWWWSPRAPRRPSWPLPIRRWASGPRRRRSWRFGITTIGALVELGPDRLFRRLGTHGHDLLRLARGEDDRPVIAEAGEAKSLGQEHTFDKDVAELSTLRKTLLDLADSVARRLRSHGLRGRTVTLKYRDETFRTLTRAETMPDPTDAGDDLFRVAWRLFEGVHGERRVRLLGIYTSGFGAGAQLDLFAPPAKAADQVRDAIDRRFGEGTLTRASLMVYPERRSTPDRRGRRKQAARRAAPPAQLTTSGGKVTRRCWPCSIFTVNPSASTASTTIRGRDGPPSAGRVVPWACGQRVPLRLVTHEPDELHVVDSGPGNELAGVRRGSGRILLVRGWTLGVTAARARRAPYHDPPVAPT
jgi:hypothetical protein